MSHVFHHAERANKLSNAAAWSPQDLEFDTVVQKLIQYSHNVGMTDPRGLTLVLRILRVCTLRPRALVCRVLTGSLCPYACMRWSESCGEGRVMWAA